MAAIKRKKRFFDVEMPIIKQDTQLLAYDLSELEGRYILYDLTRILRGKSIMLQLKVKINDGKAEAFPTQIELLQYYIRRMIRKEQATLKIHSQQTARILRSELNFSL